MDKIFDEDTVKIKNQFVGAWMMENLEKTGFATNLSKYYSKYGNSKYKDEVYKVIQTFLEKVGDFKNDEFYTDNKFYINLSVFVITNKMQLSSIFIEKMLLNILLNHYQFGKIGIDIEEIVSNALDDYPNLDFFHIYTPGESLFTGIIINSFDTRSILKKMLNCPNFDFNASNTDAHGKNILYLMCTDEDYDISLIEKLLEHLDINKANEDIINESYEVFLNPLSGALLVGNFEVAELLLSKPDIDVNQQLKYDDDELLTTPILTYLLSTDFEYKHDAIMLLLGRNDIQVNLLNSEGFPPIFYCDNLDIFKRFIAKGVNPTTRYNETDLLYTAINNNYIEITQYIVEQKWFNINSLIKDTTYFILGSYDLEILEILLTDSRINIFLKDSNGNDALNFACGTSRISIETVEFLINLKFDVNTVNTTGFTPLLRRLKRVGFDKICKFLIQKGADLNHTPKDGSSAVELAVYNKDTISLSYMIYYNADLIKIDIPYIETNFGLSGLVDRMRSKMKKSLNPDVKHTLDNMFKKKSELFCLKLIDNLNIEKKINKEWVFLDKKYNYLNDSRNKGTNVVPKELEEYEPDIEDVEREYRELSGEYYHPEDYSREFMNALVEVLSPYIRQRRQAEAELLFDNLEQLNYDDTDTKNTDWFNDDIGGKMITLLNKPGSEYFTENELHRMCRINDFLKYKTNRYLNEKRNFISTL